jgi:AAA domain/DnaB-like helicase N terminal domain
MSAAAQLLRMPSNRTLYSDAAQRGILGAVLLENSLMHEVELTVDDFFGSTDRTLFQLMLEKWGNAEPFDLTTIIADLDQTGQMERVGGYAYVASLIDYASVNGCLKGHVRTVKEFAQRRRTAALCESVSRDAWDLGARSERLLTSLEEGIRTIRADSLSASVKNWGPEIVALRDIQPVAISWVWRPYLPFGMISMLSGDPGSGKTFVLLAIAAAVTRGWLPGKTAEPGSCPIDVLYMSIENSAEYVVRPRFDSLGGDPNRFHLLRGARREDETQAVTLTDVRLLGAAIQKTGARLLIVDPIQSYLGAQVDAHRANETRPIMDGLVRLAEEHNVALILARHLAKAASGKAVYRGLGSIDLTGAVRTEMLAGVSPDDPGQLALVQIKTNIGPYGPSLGYRITADAPDSDRASFIWTGETSLSAADLLAPEASRQEKEEHSTLEAAQEFLQEALADGPRRAKELEAESGFSERTLQRAAEKLRLRRTREGERGPVLWHLLS